MTVFKPACISAPPLHDRSALREAPGHALLSRWGIGPLEGKALAACSVTFAPRSPRAPAPSPAPELGCGGQWPHPSLSARREALDRGPKPSQRESVSKGKGSGASLQNVTGNSGWGRGSGLLDGCERERVHVMVAPSGESPLVPTASALGRPGGHQTHEGLGAQAGVSTPLPGDRRVCPVMREVVGESKSMLKSMRTISRANHVRKLQ